MGDCVESLAEVKVDSIHIDVLVELIMNGFTARSYMVSYLNLDFKKAQ